MALIAVGLDHEHASLDLLERATVLEHEWVKVVAEGVRVGITDVSAYRSCRRHRPLSRGHRRNYRDTLSGHWSGAQ